MDRNDSDLRELVRGGLDRLRVPTWQPDRAITRGLRRRRVARIGAAALALALAAAVAVPLALLSGLGRDGPGRLQPSRPVPPHRCPTASPLTQPPIGIDCEAAVAQAWRVATFIDSASSTRAQLRTESVAEGYSVPAWFVTFTHARYSKADEAGCSTAGTLTGYTVVLTAASGRPLSYGTPPRGCLIDKSPALIALAYAAYTFTGPGGWQIQVPNRWRVAPVNFTQSGSSVQGVEIRNSDAFIAGVDKRLGRQTQAKVWGTSGIGVVFATDTDPTLSHQPLLQPPLQLSSFAPGDLGAQWSALSLAWTPGPSGDIGVAVKIGRYAIPDDVMLLRSMLATFRPTQSSTSASSAFRRFFFSTPFYNAVLEVGTSPPSICYSTGGSPLPIRIQTEPAPGVWNTVVAYAPPKGSSVDFCDRSVSPALAADIIARPWAYSIAWRDRAGGQVAHSSLIPGG